MSQEIVATGDAKTGDAPNAIVPTLYQETKWVDLPHINKRLLVSKNSSCEVPWNATMEKARWMTTDISFFESFDFTHPENGDWALDRAPYNQDLDDDDSVLELRPSF